MSQALSNVFKLKDIINVKDPAFGAKGDGVTDDAPATSAMFSAGGNSKKYRFPAGTYLFNTEVLANVSSVHIEGDGMGATIIRLASAAGASKAALRWSVFAQNIKISNLTIQVPTAGNTQIGLRFAELRNSRIQNVLISGPGAADDTTAIQFDGSGTFTGDVTVNSCAINNHKIGIDCQLTCTSVRILNNEFQGTSGPISGSRGVKVSNLCSGIDISGNAFQQWERGIFTEGGFITQSNNRFETNTTNWEWVRGAGNSRIWAISIGDKQISGGTPIFPRNNFDICQQVGIQDFYYDNVPVDSGLGFRERGRTTNLGEWITPTFSSGDYTAGGSMTWTVEAGDVTTMKYTLVGNVMTIIFFLVSTTIGGTPTNNLRIRIPGGFSASGRTRAPILVFNNATTTIGYAEALNSATSIDIYKDAAAANWTAGTNNNEVYGQIQLAIG